MSPDAAATGQIYWYVLDGGQLDLGQRRQIQDSLVGPQLAAVPGVAEVAAVGGFTTEVAIEVDPLELAARGILLQSLESAIASTNRSVGGQIVALSGAEFVVRSSASKLAADGQPFRAAEALDELSQILVPVGPGKTVPLAELARLHLVPGARRGVLEKDGNEAVGGVVLMRHGENPLDGDAPRRGPDRELASLAAAGRANRHRLRSHAADARSNRHYNSHADRGDRSPPACA